MSNHTINLWKKYCLHCKSVIEDLRKKAISNAEKRAAPEDTVATNATGTNSEAGTPLPIILETTVRVEPVLVPSSPPLMKMMEMEPLEEDPSDVAFVVKVFYKRKPAEERGEALWERMETTVRGFIFLGC